MPVQPAPLEQVAETTGGAAYEAATATELSDAYERIQDSLGDTLGEEIEIVNELTWQWAAARPRADRRRLGAGDVVAPRHGLTARPPSAATRPSARAPSRGPRSTRAADARMRPVSR